jgi:BlaI family transcriptional regulator, penicillinase repressor
MAKKTRPAISPLESHVMRIVASRGSGTAEDVRRELADIRPLKDSTVRTLLRRLEQKGYVRHAVEGRVHVYSASVPIKEASGAVIRTILDRFFEGSAEKLIVGMVDDRVLSVEKLQQLAARIAEAESCERRKKGSRQ